MRVLLGNEDHNPDSPPLDLNVFTVGPVMVVSAMLLMYFGAMLTFLPLVITHIHVALGIGYVNVATWRILLSRVTHTVTPLQPLLCVSVASCLWYACTLRSIAWSGWIAGSMARPPKGFRSSLL